MKKFLFIGLIFLTSCVRNPFTQKVNIHNNRVEKGLTECIEVFEPLEGTEVYEVTIKIATCYYYILIEDKMKPEDASILAAHEALQILINSTNK